MQLGTCHLTFQGIAGKSRKKDSMRKPGESEEIKAPNASFVFGRLTLLHTAQKITGMFYQVSQNSNPSILEIQVVHLGTNGVAQ